VEWIEHADQHVGVRRQCGDLVVAAVAGQVIEQHSYAYTAIRCLQKLVDQGACRKPVMNDVVLHVEADLRGSNHLHSCGKGFGAGRQQAKAGMARWVCLRQVAQLRGQR